MTTNLRVTNEAAMVEYVDILYRRITNLALMVEYVDPLRMARFTNLALMVEYIDAPSSASNAIQWQMMG